MDELGFRWCWTPRYSLQYNGIEEVWAMSKRFIKKERLNAIQCDRPFDLDKTIHESFDRMNV